MASYGKSKWEKYFSESEVKTEVYNKSGIVDVYDDANNKISEIPNGTSITVLKAERYYPKYKINFELNSEKFSGLVREVHVKKPITNGGATEHLRIYTNTLVCYGTYEVFMFDNEEISCYIFTQAIELQKSIINALEKNSNVSDIIVSTVKDILKNPSNFIWNKEISYSERNELAKYFGEVLIGFILLKGYFHLFENEHPFDSNAIRFIVPDDCRFNIVDSFIETQSGIIPISSKSGIGASGSFFSGILPTGIENYKDLQPSPFKQLISTVRKLKLKKPEKSARKIVYSSSFSHLYKPEVNHDEVFLSIKSGEYKSCVSTTKILDKIRLMNSCEKIDSLWPNSLSAFFNRMISKKLNESKLAMDDMKDAITEKKYWQVNLNKSKWHKGIVEFSVVKSSKADLKIIGSKSPIGDVAQSQGWINYTLK